MHPEVITVVMELHERHSLPINITVGEYREELRVVTLEYDLADYELARWLVNRSVVESIRRAEKQKNHD